MIKEFRIGFWNTGNFPVDVNDLFGCSSHGYVSNNKCVDPEEKCAGNWDHKLIGEAISGDYKTVLDSLSNLNFAPKFCLAFFNKAIGMEEFVTQFNLILPSVSIVGGGASRADGQSSGQLIPPAEDVSILAVSEGNFTFQSVNIYHQTDISVEIKRTTDREFELLRELAGGTWQNAIEFYRDQQKLKGINEDNFELLAFCDNYNRNVHCSPEGQSLKTGANLPDDNILHLGIVTYEDAQQKLSDFFADDNSLIFGCAGIQSLLRSPIKTGENSLAGFMFGELITMDGQPMFGNLMLAKFTCLK